MRHYLLHIISAFLCIAAAAPASAAIMETVLPIDTVTITYWKDYSEPENNYCVYTFNFSTDDDFPQIITDVVLPYPNGLSDGTYTLADGQLDAIGMFLNQADFEASIFGGDIYIFETAELQLIPTYFDNVWIYQMRLVTIEGDVYRFSFEQTPHIVQYPEDDPPSGKDKPYADESRQTTTANFTLDSLVWKDATVLQDGVLDILLTQREPETDGLTTEIHLGMYTAVAYPPAGTYPIRDSEEEGGFSASLGRYGSTLIPCYVMRVDDEGWTHAIWFLVDGSVTINYDAQGHPQLSGDATSYFGSTIRFTYADTPQGIEDIDASSLQGERGRLMLHDGQILILRGENIYTVTGQKLR